MAVSGDSARPSHPPSRQNPPEVVPGPSSPPPPAGDVSAPWLTESTYARQVTTPTGEPRRPARATGRRWFRRAFFFLVALVPISVMLVMAAVYIEARTASPQQSDAIVVLGAAQYNGNPTGVFRARLDTALQLWNDGYAPLIVLTGGRMPGDAFTEAESGAQYLIDRGIPSSALLWENQGRDTWQSIQGVDQLLRDTDVDSLIIVSDGFHLLRSELMARSFGFSVSGAASESSPIRPWSGTEFAYIIRETGGIFAAVPNLLGF